jgi:hypothetical protein
MGRTNSKTNDAGLTFFPVFRYSGISTVNSWPRLQQNDAALVTVWTAPANLGLKQKFSFLYFRENMFSLFAKKLTKSCENIRFRENFSFGMRIRIQDTYPAPKHWWMVPKNQLKKFGFGGRLREQNDCKNMGKMNIFAKTFAKTETA